jgi:hypothetical protein
MAYGISSFVITDAGAIVPVTDTGLAIKAEKQSSGMVIYALLGGTAGTIVVKHVFADGEEATISTTSCAAGTLERIAFTHHVPHAKIYYTHVGAGKVNIDVATSLGQL